MQGLQTELGGDTVHINDSDGAKCFEFHRVFQNKFKQETFCNSHPNFAFDFCTEFIKHKNNLPPSDYKLYFLFLEFLNI